MAKKKTLTRTASGSFVRNLGWKLNAAGGYAQHKFHLGRDEEKAALANLRLETLWREVQARWERDEGVHRDYLKGTIRVQNYDTPYGISTGVVIAGLPPELFGPNRPVWDELSLAIADAVRNGEAVAKVPLPDHLKPHTPDSPFVGLWLDKLQKDITVIKIEILEPTVNELAEAAIQEEGQRLIDAGRKMVHRRSGGETLFAAFTAYGKVIEQKYLDEEGRLTGWGGMQLRHIEFLRRHFADGPLGELDTQRVEDLTDLLRTRPAITSGEAASVSWIRNCVKQFRHFLRWLNKSRTFDWKRPSDLEFGPVTIPETRSERSAVARTSQVQTYRPEELQTLWEYAHPFERLTMLLALNCGFGKAEVASLELADVHLRRPHHDREIGVGSTDADSWIFRIRLKTRVYGEWKLWPETVRAIEWWLPQRAAIAPAKTSTLLVTSKGLRYDEPTKGNHPNMRIPNAWAQVYKRIRADYPDFRCLSFNKLRKTSSNLVRAKFDGELAAVFLCHGVPVRRDELLEVYTNRPFAKLFAAIDGVGEHLRPRWAGIADPFPATTLKGGPNISRGRILKIQSMRRAGCAVKDIAEAVGVSRETVRRYGRGTEQMPDTGKAS